MRRINRYIVSNVAAAMLLVMAIVLSLDFLFAFLDEFEEMKLDYDIFSAFMFVVKTLPRRIYDYLPLAAFMGCLIGLGALAKNSELVIIRASGVSTWRIVYLSMKPAFVVVIIGLILGEFVAPYTEKMARSERAVLQGAQSNIASYVGVWHREGNVFMHFNAVEPNGVLHGVSLYEYDENHKLLNSTFAKRGLFNRGTWQLESIVETHFKGARTIQETYPNKVWDTELSPTVLGVLVVKAGNLSISGLYNYSQYLKEQDLNTDEFMVPFWRKVLQPLSTCVLVLVAISFVFGPLRSVTMGFRVFSGVVVGLAFKYAQDLLGPTSIVYGFDPIFATLIPIMVCAAVGVFLLRRVR